MVKKYQVPGSDKPIKLTVTKVGKYTFDIEYIMDTGAGRHIGSYKAFMEKGIKECVLKMFTRKATQKMTFITGNGATVCQNSVGISSQLIGHAECFCLDNCPAANFSRMYCQQRFSPTRRYDNDLGDREASVAMP